MEPSRTSQPHMKAMGCSHVGAEARPVGSIEPPTARRSPQVGAGEPGPRAPAKPPRRGAGGLRRAPAASNRGLRMR